MRGCIMNKKKHLNTKIMFICVVFVLGISVILGSMGCMTYYRGMVERYQSYIEGILNITCNEIDGEDMKNCMETGVLSEKYQQTQEFFNTIKYCYDIEYMYIVKPLNTEEVDNMQYVMIGITQEEIDRGIHVELGDLSGTEYDSKVAAYYLDVLNGENKISYYANHTEFGYMYTGLVPIYDDAGDPVAVLSVDISMNELYQTIYTYIVNVIIRSLILTIAFLLIMYFWMKQRVVKPVYMLEEAAKNIIQATHHCSTPEELNYVKPDIHTEDEIQSLADSIAVMAADLKQYMTNMLKEAKEKERIASELSVATQIQSDMLPSVFPPFPERKEFDIFATMNPAKEVGGDFYDFFLVDGEHIAIVMADVSGKGVPAALFMVIAKTLIKNRTQMGGTPAEILADVNEQLCEGNEAGLFVTVWLAIIEIATGKGIAANAGHEYPALKRKDGSFELLKNRNSPAVAIMEGIQYREREFELKTGDRLFLYTDGVPEATNTENELYGTDRMIETLNRDTGRPLPQVLQMLKEDIDSFVGEAPQFDDVTMLVFDYYGPKGKEHADERDAD